MRKSIDQTIRERMAGIPLFEGILGKRLDELLRATRRLELERGKEIYRAGEPARDLFFLCSGQVKRATVSYGGTEKVLDLVFPGQAFGEFELFGSRAYSSFAIAVEPTEVLAVGGDSLRRAIEGEPRLAMRVIELLAHRALDTEQDVAASQLRSGGQRILDYLVEQVGGTLPPTGETTVTLSSRKQLIASRLGMTPETLSRLLRDLSDNGLIVLDGRSIHLQNARIAAGVLRTDLEHAVIPRRRRRLVRAHGALFPGTEPLSPVAAVNMAARQRMLSQRMTKAWLMLGRGVLPGRARAILQQSARIFEQQMAALSALAVDDTLRIHLDDVMSLWQRHRTLLDGQPTPETASELLESSERMLAAAQGLTRAYEQAAGGSHGKLVSFVGSGRYLSQRMAMFFLFSQWGISVAGSRAAMDKAREEFSAALAELMAHAPTQEIRVQMETVARHWTLLQSTLAAPDDDASRRRAAMVANASEHLLRQIEAAVSLYENLAP